MKLSQKEFMGVKVLLLYHQNQKKRSIRMTKRKKIRTKEPNVNIGRMKTIIRMM